MGLNRIEVICQNGSVQYRLQILNKGRQNDRRFKKTTNL